MATGTTPKLIFTKLLNDVDEKTDVTNSKEAALKLETIVSDPKGKKHLYTISFSFTFTD